MCEANLQLLSLLHKITNPLQTLKISFKVKGVYSPPQQWKITDQLNPNIFTYTINFLNFIISSGKIQPKKLSQKEQKEIEDIKNKKTSKKQSKEPQKLIQDDNQIKQQKEKFQALSEQEKFYTISQDGQKMYSLQFIQNQIQQNIQKQKIRNIENIIENGEIQIIVTRKPQISEEQINKLKKSKPKTLNLGELYSAQYKGRINTKQLKQPGILKLQQRIKLQLTDDIPADCVRIQAQKCYIYIQISFDKPINSLITQITPKTTSILPNFPSPQNNVKIINKLKLQIIRSVKAISHEYSIFFAKDKDNQDDRKHNNTFNSTISTLRLNEINKKKSQFLTQFSNSGKYNILKERISSTIKMICIDKFRKQKKQQKINKQQLHKTISELNRYLNNFCYKIIDNYLNINKINIHQDLILGHQYVRLERKKVISEIINQDIQSRQLRLAQQYEILNYINQAEQKYLNLILIKGNNIENLQNYGRFCLRYKKFDQAYIIYRRINQLDQNTTLIYKFILSIFLVIRNRINQAIQILLNLLCQENLKITDRILYYLFLSFIYQRQQLIHKSQQYLQWAQKYYQIKINPTISINPPKNPLLLPTPKIPKPSHYTSQLTIKQSQQILTSLIEFLAEYGFYQLLQQLLIKMTQCELKQILSIKIQIFYQDYTKAIELIEAMNKNNENNLQLILMNANICYLSQKIFESQQLFLSALKLKPNEQQIFSIYLRLGYTYLNRKSWFDAKEILNKACQIKNNSSQIWLGLGIASLNLLEFQQADQALSFFKIYNPLSSQCQLYINQIRIINQKIFQKNYQYFHQMKYIL